MSQRCRQPGWWEEYGSHLPSWFTLYVGLEDEARSLSTYQPSVVDGLLQTRGVRGGPAVGGGRFPRRRT